MSILFTEVRFQLHTDIVCNTIQFILSIEYSITALVRVLHHCNDDKNHISQSDDASITVEILEVVAQTAIEFKELEVTFQNTLFIFIVLLSTHTHIGYTLVPAVAPINQGVLLT